MNKYNFNKFDLVFNNSEYYDFQLNYDFISPCSTNDNGNLISFFNFQNFSGNTFFSDIIWDNSFNNGIKINTIGLTGLDNGFLNYNKDFDTEPNNIDLEDKILNSELLIDSGDTRFFLNKVSGYTQNISYEIIQNNNHLTLIGGFLQGFYKLDGYDYQVLPNRYDKGYTFSIWLNRDNSLLSGQTETILNDIYPDNKGFFMYFGTRAENKFWNQFSGNTSGDCLNSTTEYCTTSKETDIFLTLDNGYTVPLLPPAIEFKTITNPFLIYGRGGRRMCDSGRSMDGLGIFSVCSFNDQELIVSGYTQNTTSDINPFLIYGRGGKRMCDSGRPMDGYGNETVCSFSGNTNEPETELDVNLDVFDNALGFRIKDDGSIGYRYLTLKKECINDKTVSSITINEEYSTPNLINEQEWTNIQIKWVPYSELDECNTKPRDGKLMIYVNCRLKHTFKNFPEFIARRLNELKEKQVAVPYNISVGGGTQGLYETLTLDGVDENDLGLLIEKNFAGTFIGHIRDFKIYDKALNWCEIKNECAE